MLEVVGRPAVVNPDAALREIAAERGWPILVFAKPVAMRRPILDDPEQRKKAAVAAGVAAVGIALFMRSRSKKRKAGMN
jgi:hypothetical protein